MKKVCVISTTRAEFGLLGTFIKTASLGGEVSFPLIVSGTHLSAEYGYTVKEIRESGLAIEAEVPILSDSGENNSWDISARVMKEFPSVLKKSDPDAVLVLGDRFEVLQICLVCLYLNIPVFHISGGDVTEGAIDDCCRHAITKIAVLHFTGNAQMRKRVIQLGENPETVFDVGEIGVENALNTDFISAEDLGKRLNTTLEEGKFAVVTYHPVTTERGKEEEQINALLGALEKTDIEKIIITKANCDDGGDIINDRIGEFVRGKDRYVFVDSLGMVGYLSAVKNAAVIIGNSSSALIEAPALKTPSVNVGNRQKGRAHSESVIDCANDEESVLKAINYAMSTRFDWTKESCLYGDGNTTRKIADVIKKRLAENDRMEKKPFYDIDFEISEKV